VYNRHLGGDSRRCMLSGRRSGGFSMHPGRA
jgi:hypothetical protein